jgi:hypothetical protein
MNILQKNDLDHAKGNGTAEEAAGEIDLEAERGNTVIEAEIVIMNTRGRDQEAGNASIERGGGKTGSSSSYLIQYLESMALNEFLLFQRNEYYQQVLR